MQKCSPTPNARFLEHDFVAVGARVEHQELVALADATALELAVFEGIASHVHDGRAEAEHLLDRRGQERTVRSQPLERLGMLEKQQQPVRDQVASRLVARDGEQQEERVELERAEALALDLAVEQRAHQVVTGGREPVLRESIGEEEHLLGRPGRFLESHDVFGILVSDHPVAPVEDVVAGRLRDPEQFCDHAQRQLGGDVDDEIAGPTARHAVENVLHDLAVVRFLVDDLAGGVKPSWLDSTAVPLAELKSSGWREIVLIVS